MPENTLLMSIQQTWLSKLGRPSTMCGKRVRVSSAASGRLITEACTASPSQPRRFMSSVAISQASVVSVERSVSE